MSVVIQRINCTMWILAIRAELSADAKFRPGHKYAVAMTEVGQLTTRRDLFSWFLRLNKGDCIRGWSAAFRLIKSCNATICSGRASETTSSVVVDVHRSGCIQCGVNDRIFWWLGKYYMVAVKKDCWASNGQLLRDPAILCCRTEAQK